MIGLMRVVALVCASVLAATTAAAQGRPSSAEVHRAQGREALAEGRFADAYGHLRRAAAEGDDPAAWLEVAEAADRLRMNEHALDALARYLAARPDAPDRPVVEARIRVLRQILEGARYVASEDGDTVRLIHDWEGEPSLPNPPGEGAGRGGANILVDWSGRPMEGRRTREMLALADWDGVIRGEGPDEPVAPPPPEDVGLGRRLATP